MKRLHLFEFLDLPWYPHRFRRIPTDHLQVVDTRGTGHKSIIPLMKRALEQAQTSDIADLCSGGSGLRLNLHHQLADVGYPVRVKVTDVYPHPEAAQLWIEASD